MWALWLQLQTLWRFHPSSGLPVGLDWAGVAAVVQLRQIKPHRLRHITPFIQAMERAALTAWQERKS